MDSDLKLRRPAWARRLKRGLLAENLGLTLCAAALIGALGALATVVFRELLGWMQLLVGAARFPTAWCRWRVGWTPGSGF